MQTASGLPIRKRIRLPAYDYSGDATYFVTVCAFQRQCLFGDCIDGTVELGDIGNIVEEEWRRTAFRGNVTLGEYQVMPNHLHGLLFIANKEIDDNEPLRRELFRIIGGFKSAVTSRVRTRVAMISKSGRSGFTITSSAIRERCSESKRTFGRTRQDGTRTRITRRIRIDDDARRVG